MISDPTKRFSDRIDNYVKYRPGYPPEVIDFLQNECGLSGDSVIADIGSGTGIFTKLLLDAGYKVYAVERNIAMQQAALQQFAGNKNFISINATAEATSLMAKSIDLVACAQAFHWFSGEKALDEFKRILKDNGYVALIWNNRLAGADDFSAAYENLLKQAATDYEKVNHRNVNEINLKGFFKDSEYKLVKYPNVQIFDEDGLMGRAFSSSYVPQEGTEAGEKFRKLLHDIFVRHNKNGAVCFYYQTEVYLGMA